MPDEEKQQEELSDFVFISLKDVSSEEKQQEEKDIRSINTPIDVQFKRDISMLGQAIVNYGCLESEKVKAHTLLKSLLLLYFGDVAYRDKGDKQFHSLNELNHYCENEAFPIAAILLHGSRTLIEFPSDISEQLIDWLIIDKSSWRWAATHGIQELMEEEREIVGKEIKYLKEIKINPVRAGFEVFSDSVNAVLSKVKIPLTTATSAITNTTQTVSTATNILHQEKKKDHAQHYGINLALGGVGNRNFFSNQTIHNDGSHGHLYVNYHEPIKGSYAGLLLGIEQSAPGIDDQYGGSHDAAASQKNYSASGPDAL